MISFEPGLGGTKRIVREAVLDVKCIHSRVVMLTDRGLIVMDSKLKVSLLLEIKGLKFMATTPSSLIVASSDTIYKVDVTHGDVPRIKARSRLPNIYILNSLTDKVLLGHKEAFLIGSGRGPLQTMYFTERGQLAEIGSYEQEQPFLTAVNSASIRTYIDHNGQVVLLRTYAGKALNGLEIDNEGKRL